VETNKSLEMTFVADDGKKVTISVPSPRANMTESEVNNAMNQLIAADIFSDNHGSLIEKSGARTVTRTIETIQVA